MIHSLIIKPRSLYRFCSICFGYTIRFSNTSLDFSKAAANNSQALGIDSHSVNKHPQSRSFSQIMASAIPGAMVRTLRQTAIMFSNTWGLRLCGIVEEPTLPMKNGSSNSRISVRCKLKISWAMRPNVPAHKANVLANSAWLSRATCQEMVGWPSPKISIMRCCVSKPFSGCDANVPTAPDIWPTNTRFSISSNRWISRPSSSAHTATL